MRDGRPAGTARRVLDATGPVREGMWSYEPPYPRFRMGPLGPVPWAGAPVRVEVFEGMHSQTGTYLETAAHFIGDGAAPFVDDLPVASLLRIPAVVLHVERTGRAFAPGAERAAIDADDLARAAGGRPVPEGAALLVATGWGRFWMHPRYLDDSPFLRASAMDWLLARRPFLVGSDFARWENLERPEGFFPAFFASGALMLAPLAALEDWPSDRARLTALPLRIPGTSGVPCRAVLEEAEDAGGGAP